MQGMIRRFKVKQCKGFCFGVRVRKRQRILNTVAVNGVPLPSIWLRNSETDDLCCVCEFGWEENSGSVELRQKGKFELLDCE